MSYRSICNKCGRTGIGADYSEAQPKIQHKDSCPTQNIPKVKEVKVDPPKEETPKVVKAKKTPKKVPQSED